MDTVCDTVLGKTEGISVITTDTAAEVAFETADVPVTWADVARRLASLDPAEALWQSRPRTLLGANVYWTGIRLDILNEPQAEASALSWLERVFPHRVRNEKNFVSLIIDGPSALSRLPIRVEIADEDDSFVQRPRATVESDISFSGLATAEAPSGQMPVFACHSVKGGVGRTTSAIALAHHLGARLAKPILLIDGDFEAPGISFLLRDSRAEFSTSFEDLLAIRHADPSANAEMTLSFVTERMNDLRVGNLFVMPVRRQPEDLVGSTIRVEHLANDGGSEAFVLTSLLRSLGERLGCGAIVVDLRAGMVPIAAQLLLDPSVARLFVTTISGQALAATTAMLQFVGRELRRHSNYVSPPLILFNRVPSIFESANAADALRQPLLQSAVQAFNGNADSVAQGLSEATNIFLEPVMHASIGELSELAVTANGLAEFSSQIRISNFFELLSPQLDDWLSALGLLQTEPDLTTAFEVPTNIGIARNKLARFASLRVAAELAEDPNQIPLITAPLRQMAVESLSRLPILISEGTKGTGKTLMARFLIAQGNWRKVVIALSGRTSTYDSAIVPVYCSTQAGGKLLEEATAQRSQVAASFGFSKAISLVDLKDTLLSRFAIAIDDASRSSIWLDAIAWSIGFQIGVAGAGRTYLDQADSSAPLIVALFEGLEELFPDIRVPYAAAAVRALIVDTANRLRLAPGRRVGLIVFARSDSVATAIPQNLEQFRLQNRDFALTWTEADVLELGAWLATKSSAVPGLWVEDWRSLPESERAERLSILWGSKLGPDDTMETRVKEARTSLWLVAVLSDLQGRITARDFVRLIENAADYQPPAQIDVLYPKRVLLTPWSARSSRADKLSKSFRNSGRNSSFERSFPKVSYCYPGADTSGWRRGKPPGIN